MPGVAFLCTAVIDLATWRRFTQRTTGVRIAQTRAPPMAEKQPGNSNSLERRPVVVSSGSSSNELSVSGSSDLQSFSLGRVSSSSNLSSYTVPVRLDVLYFLLNSAAKGAQNALPPVPVHGGQGAFSSSPTPVAQYAVNCGSCCHSVPSCAGIQQHNGPHHFGAGHGGHGGQNAGVPESQNYGHRWGNPAQRCDEKALPGSSQPNSAVGWNRAQSLTGWKENQRGGGGGRNWDNGQGRRPDVGRSWGDRRQGMGEWNPWKSGLQGRRREESSFSSNSSNVKRSQEGSPWQMVREAPEAKRRSDGAGLGWRKTQGMQEPASFVGNVADPRKAKPAAEDNGEDWETDYESGSATATAPRSVPHSSHQKGRSDASKASEDWEGECTPSTDLPKPLPESVSKARSVPAAGTEPAASPMDQSKNGGFVRYLKGLYSDLPGKSSSEGSTDLAIDTDAESSKPDEEEQSSKDAAGEDPKSWEQIHAIGLAGRSKEEI